MRTVSRFEANLLQIVHCLLGRAPLAQTLSLVVRTYDRPPCLGRDCVELIKQSLSTGVSLMLAREDGWFRERFMREEQVADGRLWERSSPDSLGVAFSINSLDFLMWLTASSPLVSHWKPHKLQATTLGDWFLFYLAFRAMRGTEVAKRWCEQPLFHTNGLCALMFPDDFAEYGVDPEPDFAPWLAPPGATMLEALQSRLAERWVEVERSKSRIVSAERMRLLGRVQERVLTTFTIAAEQADRRELARFLLVAAQLVLSKSPSPENWTAVVDVRGLRVADRLATYRAAFALLRGMRRLADWEERARNIGYFDEGYTASQLWKSDWERFDGKNHCETARAITRAIEPLDSSTTVAEH